jgi:hypothetical protein
MFPVENPMLKGSQQKCIKHRASGVILSFFLPQMPDKTKQTGP